MIVETVMPRYDTEINEHIVVAADPAATYRAARNLDLLTVRTPLLVASMWLRALPGRLSGRAGPSVSRLVIANGGLPGWLVLGEDADREIAFGAVGKFWRPTIEWREVELADFAGFDEPGWGRIAANFSVRPYGRGSLLSYECRTVTTDPVSRRRFLRYWWLIRPFVAHIMRATVRTIKSDAEATLTRSDPRP
jgi:hypothetical protein